MLKIDEEFKSLIPPLSTEEHEQLEQNLIKETNPDSIVLLTWEGTLIDGHNRYEICQKHNIEFKTVEKDGFKDRDDVKVWIINNQFGRRNINNYQRSVLALKLEELFKTKAKLNMVVASHPKIDMSVVLPTLANQQKPKLKTVDTREEVAKVAKVSHGTLDKVKVIEQKAAPEVKKELEAGTKSINEVYKEIKNEEKQEARQEQIEQIKQEIQENPEPINGKYDIIVIDPPWEYGTEYDPGSRRAASPYPEMGLEDIKNIEIPSSENCVLWLWTTHKFMRHSFEVLDKWGFEDKAILTWVKDRIGLGSWLRSQSEFCIMATKGKPIINLTNQSTIINAPLREHSRKPNEFYDMVDSLCVGRKLDYFSREKRQGWAQYGNESTKF